MKIAFCSHHHITTEGCQWSHGMNKITENILNLIFCVRLTYAMLIVGLVKYLSWLPIVRRIKSKAGSRAHKALRNPNPSSISSRSDFSEPRRYLSQGQAWAYDCEQDEPRPSFHSVCVLMRTDKNTWIPMKEIITDCIPAMKKRKQKRWEEGKRGKGETLIIENWVCQTVGTACAKVQKRNWGWKVYKEEDGVGGAEGERRRWREWDGGGQRPAPTAPMWIMQTGTLSRG